MPNLGSPGRGPTTIIQDPWSDLATQALAAVVQQGISNSFQKDYTTQAQNEGLAVDPEAKAAAWYKKPFTGATTDKAQIQQLRGEKAQTKRAVLSENAAGQRQAESLAAAKGNTEAQIAATREEGTKNRAHDVDVAKLRQLFQSAENTADRTARTASDEAQRTMAYELSDRQIAAQERELGRKLTSQERLQVTDSIIDNISQIYQKDNPAVRGIMDQNNSKMGLPPTQTPDATVDNLIQALEKRGFKLIPPQ